MKKSIQNWIIFSFLATSLTACALAMAPYRGDQTFKREVPRSINGVYRSILDYAITHNFEVPAHSEARGILTGKPQPSEYQEDVQHAWD